MKNAAISRYRIEDGKACIEAKMESLSHLFDSRDPAPFRQRDLDPDAFEYIYGAVRELGFNAPAKLVFYFTGERFDPEKNKRCQEAIRGYFGYEYETNYRALKSILRRGVISAFIGLSFLAICTFLSASYAKHPERFMASVVTEGFLIVGWVAMWRPIDIFLYAWWPLVPKQRILKRLTQIEIEILEGHS